MPSAPTFWLYVVVPLPVPQIPSSMHPIPSINIPGKKVNMYNKNVFGDCY